jgi:hypothetical protein
MGLLGSRPSMCSALQLTVWIFHQQFRWQVIYLPQQSIAAVGRLPQRMLRRREPTDQVPVIEGAHGAGQGLL